MMTTFTTTCDWKNSERSEKSGPGVARTTSCTASFMNILTFRLLVSLARYRRGAHASGTPNRA